MCEGMESVWDTRVIELSDCSGKVYIYFYIMTQEFVSCDILSTLSYCSRNEEREAISSEVHRTCPCS